MTRSSRVTIFGYLAGSVCLFGVAGTGCHEQGQEAGAVVPVVAGGVYDWNDDDRSDFFVITEADPLYSGIMLASEGETAFRLHTLSDVPEMPSPWMDSSWEDRGLIDIKGTHDEVRGLDEALSILPIPQRRKLGLPVPYLREKSLEECWDGVFCVWEHTYFAGGFAYLTNGWWWPNVGDWWNDNISSWQNRTGQWYSLWEHSNYGGGCFNQFPGNGVADANEFVLCHRGCGVQWYDGTCCETISWNDQVTSIKPGTGNCAEADHLGYDCSSWAGC